MTAALTRAGTAAAPYDFADDRLMTLDDTFKSAEVSLWEIPIGPGDVVTCSVFNPDPNRSLTLITRLGHRMLRGGGVEAIAKKVTTEIAVSSTNGVTVQGEAIDFVRFTLTATVAGLAWTAAGQQTQVHIRVARAARSQFSPPGTAAMGVVPL